MTHSKFQELLKESLACMKEKTVFELSKVDIQYQDSMHELSESEELYMNVQKELKEEHKRVIEKYISDLEIENSLMSDLSYISGIIDTMRLILVYIVK